MGAHLDRLLEQYADVVATRRVVVARDASVQLPGLLAASFPERRSCLLIADPNTWTVAGCRTSDELAAAGFSVGRLILEPQPGKKKIHADENRVAQVAERLGNTSDVPLAVGAGTLNDIVKMAAFRHNRHYAVVATAPSMNGWTSAIAAIVVAGLKETLPARGPVLIAADSDVLRQAPAPMINAGFADMMAKGVASADWRLADRLLGSGYDARVEQVSKAAIDLLEGTEAAIADRQADAIERLMEGLCISGLSMAVAGSSAHISGAEHLFSHYIDMMMPEIVERELHGRQVGIGTLCAAAFYEQALAWTPDDFDVDARVAAQPPWDVRRGEIERHFGRAAPAVVDEARATYTEGEALRARLNRLAAEWPSLRDELRTVLASRAQIEERLEKVGAPTHFSDLGLSQPQTRDILTWAKDIRGRYTVFHLAADLGLLERWIEHALEAFNESSRR